MLPLQLLLEMLLVMLILTLGLFVVLLLCCPLALSFYTAIIIILFESQLRVYIIILPLYDYYPLSPGEYIIYTRRCTTTFDRKTTTVSQETYKIVWQRVKYPNVGIILGTQTRVYFRQSCISEG